MKEVANAKSVKAMLKKLKAHRENFLDSHPEAGDWRNCLFSGTTLSMWLSARSLVRQECSGLVLDAGAGRGALRTLISDTGSERHSIDLADRGDEVLTWQGDITSMPQVPDRTYDAVVCNQVLEHVRVPEDALKEFGRVLKPGGKILLWVPHLSRLHELPHDYYRYTENGLVCLVERAGFTILRRGHYGSILSFLHHQFSSIFVSCFAGIPFFSSVAVLLNSPLTILCAGLDSLIDSKGYLATGVWVVARKES